MTFEATDTRAPATAADETNATGGRPARRSARPEHPADTMMNFVMESEGAATRLRGLAMLFRGVFCDDELRRSDDGGAAADIIDDVMRSIAAGLDANADRARVARDHLTRGGAR